MCMIVHKTSLIYKGTIKALGNAVVPNGGFIGEVRRKLGAQGLGLNG